MAFDDMPIPLDRADTLAAETRRDDLTAELIQPYDFTWEGRTEFAPWALPAEIPADFGIGVIVGASGSGKSTLLRAMGEITPPPDWSEGESIASHFTSAEDAAARLIAVGLSSVPVWCKPYHVLSNGEKFRADLARVVRDGARIDEFSSVVDRSVAKAASLGLAQYARAENIRGLVLATCHRDVLPWLRPDWFIDTDAGELVPNPRECLQRPEMVVEVHRSTLDAWDKFMGHHYLRADIHRTARRWIATWDDALIGFASSLPFPHAVVKKGYREHRTVILPEYQGLGLGVRLSDHVAALHVAEGKRYFSRTTHPRMGEYRERSALWRPTDKNRKRRHSLGHNRQDLAHWGADTARVAYSHEYVGPGTSDGGFVVEPIERLERAA
jgi:GNAT superfamily N-acetyltransferase